MGWDAGATMPLFETLARHVYLAVAEVTWGAIALAVLVHERPLLYYIADRRVEAGTIDWAEPAGDTR